MDPQKAVQVLIDRKWTQAEIAHQVGVTQPTIARIKAGDMEPNYSTGKKLVDLAQRPR